MSDSVPHLLLCLLHDFPVEIISFIAKYLVDDWAAGLIDNNANLDRLDRHLVGRPPEIHREESCCDTEELCIECRLDGLRCSST